MTRPSELRAKANELYDFAQTIDDADERLPYVLRAIELEAEAIMLEQESATGTVMQAYSIKPPSGGNTHERA